ncbi:MAG: hypothetical protein E5V25_11045, partial [Mesorhizobium sp.]
MPHPVLDAPISPLRQRLIDDMTMRRFGQETQRNYVRDVGRFASFLGRSPDTAISNRRLSAFDESRVTFRYKDYRRDG